MEELLDYTLKEDLKIKPVTRLKSMFYDYLFFCVTSPFIFGIFIIPRLYLKSPDLTYTDILFLILVTAYMISKDIFASRSFGKRRTNTYIIDIQTNKTASGVKTILRNITIMIWPLEIVIAIVNPKRRIGDFIAGTKIVQSANKSHKKDIDKKQIVKDYSFAILCSIILNSFAYFIFK